MNAAIEPELSIAREPVHLRGILALQQRNLHTRLSADQQAQSGFVYAEHDEALLAKMAASVPQAIALHAGEVIGYSLAMAPSMQHFLPTLAPMFDQFARMQLAGRWLSDYRYVVGGQVCVDAAWRGRGLIGRLYAQTRDSVDPAIELCLTEIALRNEVSLRAHQRLGFIEVGRYADAGEEWAVVAWPWRSAR